MSGSNGGGLASTPYRGAEIVFFAQSHMAPGSTDNQAHSDPGGASAMRQVSDLSKIEKSNLGRKNCTRSLIMLGIRFTLVILKGLQTLVNFPYPRYGYVSLISN